MADPITRSGTSYSLPRDSNRVPVMGGVLAADGKTVVPFEFDGSNNLLVNVAAGGSGGGAVTVADGADVAEGATTDAAVTAGSTGTVSGKLRQISSDISSVKTNTTITATGASVPSGAIYNGVLAKTALPTAVTDGQLVGAMGDKFGRPVFIPNAQRDLVLPITQLTLTATTTETTLITGVASTFLDLISLVITNTSATATQVDFRDSTTGTVRLSFYVPGGDTRGIALPVPLPQAVVNNNWTAKCGTSVTSVVITGSYITNK